MQQQHDANVTHLPSGNAVHTASIDHEFNEYQWRSISIKLL